MICRNIFTLMLFLCCAIVLPFDAAAKAGGGETVIGEMQVRMHLEDYLASRQADYEDVRLKLKSFQIPARFTPPSGKLTCSVMPANSDLLRNRYYTLIFRVDGQVVKNLTLRADVEAIGTLVVAAADLPRGTLLSAQDVELVETDLSQLRSPLRDPSELIGKKVKRLIRAGKPVERSSVEFPHLIKHGDSVVVQVRKGNLYMTVTGLARQNGRLGDMVRVRNSISKREFLCRTIGKGLATMEL